MTSTKMVLIAALAVLPVSAFAKTSHRKHMMNVHKGHVRNVAMHTHHSRMHMMNVHKGHMRNMREHAGAMKAPK